MPFACLLAKTQNTSSTRGRATRRWLSEFSKTAAGVKIPGSQRRP